jgi:hypothetical protein
MVSPTILVRIFDLVCLTVKNLREKIVKKLESVSQTITCSSKLLKPKKESPATNRALIPINNWTKAVGNTSSIRHRIMPSNNQIAVKFCMSPFTETRLIIQLSNKLVTKRISPFYSPTGIVAIVDV